jgi:Fe-S cluster assembly protein SufB
MATLSPQSPNKYTYGFHVKEKYSFKSQKGLSQKIVKQISRHKKEQAWITQFRLKALKIFLQKPLPGWGSNLSKIDFDNIYYYIKPINSKAATWKDLPLEIKQTYDRIGIPEAEKKYLSGVSAQYESEIVYKSIIDSLKKRGVIFVDPQTAFQKYQEVFKPYFASVIPISDNKFSALNSAVFSGGSFIYIPKGVHVDMPLQAYFRINAKNMGQFERTLIIADEGSFVHYVEGCTAPIYSSDSLHSAVVEIIVKKNARVRYTTIQNWSKNVYNLVTKRALVEENGIMEWVDANLGSKLTMKYPSVYLVGKNAKGHILSLAFASNKQHLDAGAKVLHLAPNTSSTIISKSICKNGGRTSYRGLLQIEKGAVDSKSFVRCDALLMDEKSRSDTYPTINVKEQKTDIGHEAVVSKIGEEQMFYLQNRGLSQEDAQNLIVSGFIEPIVKELPMEYAVEMNRLIKLEMNGSVG